jgi:hypothetical protein
MTAPTLQLVDGCLLLDNSTRQNISMCPRFAAYKHIWKREKAGVTAKGCGPGKAIHAALETRYRTCGGKRPTDEQQAAVIDALHKAYGDEQQPDGDDYLNPQRLAEVVNQYRVGCRYEMGKAGKNGIYQFPGYGDEGFEVLAVELPFAVVLGKLTAPPNMIVDHPQAVRVGPVAVIPLIYIGRSDLVVRFQERGETVVVDHKTGRRFDNSTVVHWTVAAGPKGYARCIPQWIAEGIDHLPQAVREAMLPFEPERKRLAAAGVTAINGFMLNQLTIRNVSDLTRCKEAPTSFHRHQVFYDSHVLDEWRADTLNWAASWLRWSAERSWPLNDNRCSSHFGMVCPYYEVCSSPPDQRDLVLSTDLYQDNTWNPLKREEAI